MQDVDFQKEQAKRDRMVSPEQTRAWADDLLQCLPDSLAYQQKCTPQARMQEEIELNHLVEDWLSRHQPSDYFVDSNAPKARVDQ